jgi:hypothetical protein
VETPDLTYPWKDYWLRRMKIIENKGLRGEESNQMRWATRISSRGRRSRSKLPRKKQKAFPLGGDQEEEGMAAI